MKVAYLCEPQVGGTYSFFRRIRPAIRREGIEFRCVPPLSGERFEGSPYVNDEGLDLVRFPEGDAPAATRQIIAHLVEEQFDAVLILPGTDMVCTNLVRYLPRHIRALARVPMFTRGAYAPTQALQDSLDGIVCVCHRIARDLEETYKVQRDRLCVIYNGIPLPPVPPGKPLRKPGDPFTIIFSGRLLESHKGILLLPEILSRLLNKGVDAHLLVVGEGPDEDALRHAVGKRKMTGRVTFVKSVTLERVMEYLQAADCFVLPSRYEGCPNALLEAMAARCACVVSRLAGSTDRIIEDGKSGYLAEVGSVPAFCEKIMTLAEDPALCVNVGNAARERIAQDFTIEKTAGAYAQAFREVRDAPDRREPVCSLEDYDVPAGLKPTWRTRIPDPIKNFARVCLERLGRSS